MALPAIAPYPVPTLHELPKSRVDWELSASGAVLLVHDMQNYFVGAYEVDAEPLRTVVANIATLIDAARAVRIPVVYSAQPGDQDPRDRRLLSDFWGPGLRAVEEHEAIVPELAPQPGDTVLTKWRYSAFQRTSLRALMQSWGRDQLVVTGIYAHMGCLMTACEAFMQDIQPFFVPDAVADFSLDDHQMAIKYAALRCATITATDDLVHQLRSTTVERIVQQS